ncbi:MAG: ABC transporter permease subunit [Chloroflexi bacterium]|nr:ABC transporter permease subunit [Chloroflexota bacterium]
MERRAFKESKPLEYLERRYPEDWGKTDRHEITGAGGGELVINLIAGLRAAAGLTVVMVSHQPEDARRIAARPAFVNAGKILGWYLYGVRSPSGTEVHHNYAVVEVFGSFEAMENSYPEGVWEKVHPGIKMEEVGERTWAARDLVRKDLGLDGSIFEQYGTYLWNLAQLDFGESFQAKEDVLSEIGDRIGPSLELGILQIIIALLVAVPIGIISAIRQDSAIDYILRFVAIALLGIPVFVLGVFVLLLTSRELGYTPPLTTYRDLVGFPPFGTDKPVDVWTNLQIMAMPAIIGGLGTGAIIMRFLRSQMLEVMRQDYVRTAWAKGLRERVVIMRHALKNALIPVLTVVGLLLGTIVSANVILETIFVIPGIGLWVVNAIGQFDYPVIQGVVLVVATILVFTNLIVDITYAWLDPRIRYG